MRTLSLTSREAIRWTTGVNTHFPFDQSVYSHAGVPNQTLINAITYSRISTIRERIWPNSKAQQSALQQLGQAGVMFYVFIGDMHYTVAKIADEVRALSTSPLAPYVRAICGPNECNASQVNGWAEQAAIIQQAIYTEVRKYNSLTHCEVVGSVLKHNVRDWESDLHKAFDAGITQWCDAYDFHYYPGAQGPVANAGQIQTVRNVFGNFPLYMSETGWTNDVAKELVPDFTVEAYLRNYLNGIKATFIYEFADEYPTDSGITLHEGLFGIHTATTPKAAYAAVQKLTAPVDAGIEFPGWLARGEDRIESDVQAIVLSNTDSWNVYLFPVQDTSVTLILPGDQFDIYEYGFEYGTAGNRRFDIPLDKSMVSFTVNKA